MSIQHISKSCNSFCANTQNGNTGRSNFHETPKNPTVATVRLSDAASKSFQQSTAHSLLSTYCTVHNNFGKSCLSGILYWNRQMYNTRFLSRLTCILFFLPLQNQEIQRRIQDIFLKTVQF